MESIWPWCRWQELSPEGFALEVQSQLERQGRGGCWGTVTQEQSQEMESSVSDTADSSKNKHRGLKEELPVSGSLASASFQ